MHKLLHIQSMSGKYSQYRLKAFALFPLFLFALFCVHNVAMGSGNFVRINLPKGLEVDLPQNWIVLSNNQRITLDSSVESRLDLSALPNPDSKLPFAANYYNDAGETIGIANVRYYPNIDLSQADRTANNVAGCL